MDRPVVPEYGRRSLAEVLPAAIAALGGPAGSPGILTLPRSRAVALLLIDGLGYELLRAHAADAPFLSGLTELGPLTAGFPSSTVVSLTSLGTGLPPGAHGLVGTSVRIGRDVLDALHWRKHAPKGRDLRNTLIPEDVQPFPTALEQAVTACIGVTSIGAAAFRGSGLTRAALTFLISSSSSICQIGAPSSSPSISRSAAARCAPGMAA